MAETQNVELLWRSLLMGEWPALRRGRRVLKFIPSDPRCKLCNAPFEGIGAPFMRFIGRRPAKANPRFCDFCERFARTNVGGTEIELSLLFADVRDSTALAERSSATEFGRLMNRFYATATRALIETDGLIDKLVGDEVIGHYYPGFAGPRHAQQAILAAQRLLAQTGHDRPGGPWLPVGAGVHTGTAYAGTVGSSDTFTDFTALGDAVNIAARLASLAQKGEILISEAACSASGMELSGLERRTLALKGHEQPIEVRVWRVGEAPTDPLSAIPSGKRA